MSYKSTLHKNVAGWYIWCQLIDILHIWNRVMGLFYNWSGFANQHIQILDNRHWGRVSEVDSESNSEVDSKVDSEAEWKQSCLVFFQRFCTANCVPDVTVISCHLWWSCLVLALPGCLSKELRWKCNWKRLKISFIIITTMPTMRCLSLYWISSTLLWK